jgi:phage repressor protein C with HTH and peptisase S24 domain
VFPKAGLRWLVVRGPSMAPTLSDGDIVLVRFGRAARPGDVVLVRWTSRPAQLSVKRAQGRVDGGWTVRGDNPYGSTDSATLGPAHVLGVVVARLWPRPRRLHPRRRATPPDEWTI